MTPFVQAVKEAAGELFAELQKGWRPELAEHGGAVGAGGDESTRVDRLAEAIYIRHLQSFGKIDSEECGLVGQGEATVVLDPIDGSSNLLSGLPYYGSSAALERNGRVEEAVVVNLANGDFFFKTSQGFFRQKLWDEEAVDVTVRPNGKIGLFEKVYEAPELALSLMRQKIKFRAPGAVALSLAYAHDVEFVIFAGPRRRYDFAAALWMCEELALHQERELLIVSKSAQTLEKIRRLAQNEERV